MTLIFTKLLFLLFIFLCLNRKPGGYYRSFIPAWKVRIEFYNFWLLLFFQQM